MSSLVPSAVKCISSCHTHTAAHKTCFTYYQLLLWFSWEFHQTKTLLVMCVSYFPNSSLIELWGEEPTRKVTQTNAECERLSQWSNLLLAGTCYHPRFGRIKKYLFTKNPGPNFTLYAKTNLTEAKGLNLRHQTKKENGRKGPWTWHRTIGSKRRKR